MYTVSRGPTRIINRTRRDLSQKLENLEVNRELRRKNSGGSDDSDQIIMSSPRPTFQSNVPNKNPRNGNSRHNSNSCSSNSQSSPPLSPSHIEMVNYFASAWANVQEELDHQMQEGVKQNGHDDRGVTIRVYQEKELHAAMKDFQPFELEDWWGRRLYSKLTED